MVEALWSRNFNLSL